MSLPLDSFPLVRTADLDHLRSALTTLFQDSTFAIGSDRNAVSSSINYCPLQYTGLMYGNFGPAIRASFGEMQFYVQGFTVNGSGEQTTNGSATSANVGGLLSPNTNLQLGFSAGFETIALNIEAEAVMSKLSAIIGFPPNKPIRFEVDPKFDHPATLKMRQLVGFLVEDLSSNGGGAPVVALVEMEQALITWFLVGNRHNYSHLLDGRSISAAPWQVKRVEEYIEASWDQPLTIEVLAEVTGASVQPFPCLQAMPRLLAHGVSQASAPATRLADAQCAKPSAIRDRRRIRVRLRQSRPFREIFSRQIRREPFCRPFPLQEPPARTYEIAAQIAAFE